MYQQRLERIEQEIENIRKDLETIQFQVGGGLSIAEYGVK
jgi:uncharacterized protein (UPF0335 family)